MDAPRPDRRHLAVNRTFRPIARSGLGDSRTPGLAPSSLRPGRWGPTGRPRVNLARLAFSASAKIGAWEGLWRARRECEGDKPARQTADIYRQHLQRIFLLDPIEAWTPAFAPLKRLTHSPKHHLVDPALAARLVGVGKTGLLRGQGNRVHAATGTWLGALFESLAAQSVRVYAEAADAHVGHLRTKNTDHEIDLIVETADRSTVGIEVKLTDTIRPADVEHLNWLGEQLGDRLGDRMIIYTGKHAYRRPDGIAVVPLALLGP
ncbi:DUF4143 domain-containing protein [Propioniciclava soli]|uniref:DUF4143 domain-containing protein n=1 Tax=Propioniciclava soli TaxID=2775081 RepID=UPI001E28CF3B